MPSATGRTAAKASKPRAGAARKAPRAKATAARKPAARKPAAKATAKASARYTSTRSPLHQVEAAIRDREAANLLGDYAERAVLIPVGAALLARDRVVSTVTDTLSTYSSTSKTQAQLRRFERRGVTARNRLEREVRKARVRVERQLRTRRRVVENRVSNLEDRRETFAKNGSEIAGRVPEIAKEVQERILSLV